MKKILSGLILSLMIMHIMHNLLVITGFQLNRTKITTLYCTNIVEKIPVCGATCYLSKQLISNEKKQSTEASNVSYVEYQYFESRNSTIINSLIQKQSDNFVTPQLIGHKKPGHLGALYKPPII